MNVRATVYTAVAILLPTILCPLLSPALAAPSADAGNDWPQWRGPLRNGVAPRGPSLAAAWPDDGPPVLWEVADIPGGGGGGYGSPVVAGGRVYLFVNRRYSVPIDTRTVSGDSLHRLGWTKDRPTAGLLAELEAARVGPERAALQGGRLNEWVDAWVKARLSKEDEQKFGHFVRTRLQKGTEAVPPDTLDKLQSVRDRAFPSQAELDAWLDSQKITGDVRKHVLAVVATEQQKAHDEVYCLDAGSGKQIWKQRWDGNSGDASSTLCVTGGRVYGLASGGEAFCLDAENGGRPIWRTKCGGGGHASVLVVEGRAVVLSDALTALDAATGDVVWKQDKVRGHESSPVAWHSGGGGGGGGGGGTYVLCNTGGGVFCVALSDGAVRWSVPGGSPSTVAVADDHMAVLTDKADLGLVAYRITPGGAERAWNIKNTTDRGASPAIHDGHVYALAGDRTVCVDLQSGRLVWEGRPGKGDISSPALADGKLFAPVGGFLAMVRAGRGEFEVLDKARIPLAPCTSPAVAGGRLYVRTNEGLACHDLTAAAQAEDAAELASDKSSGSDEGSGR